MSQWPAVEKRRTRNAGAYGAMHWNEGYHVFGDVVAPHVYIYPLAHNLVLLLVVTDAEEVALQWELNSSR